MGLPPDSVSVMSPRSIEVGFPVHSPDKDSWLQDSVALELFQAKKQNMKNPPGYLPKLTKQKIQSNNIKLDIDR